MHSSGTSLWLLLAWLPRVVEPIVKLLSLSRLLVAAHHLLRLLRHEHTRLHGLHVHIWILRLWIVSSLRNLLLSLVTSPQLLKKVISLQVSCYDVVLYI
jgi:hypothetical protein